MSTSLKSIHTMLIGAIVVGMTVAAPVLELRSSARSFEKLSLTPVDCLEESAVRTVATHFAAPIEPALTQVANKFTAIPDFSGITTPGQLLKITLSQSGSAARRPPIGIRPIGPRSPLPIKRPPVVSRPGRRVVNLRSISRVADRGRRPTIARITDAGDCNLVPNLCQDIPLPGTNLKLTNVKITVEWKIVDRNDPNLELTENTNFHSEKLQGLSRLFVIAPFDFAEMTPSKPPARDFAIIAKITLTADKVPILGGPGTAVQSEDVRIDIPLALSFLEVPSIFVLFLDKDFGGAAAVYVPADSTLSESALTDAVRRVADTYNPVASRLNFVAWFATYLAGIRELQHTFALPHWDLKELKNQESNLNDDDFIHRSPFTSLNDTEVEDESSALLMMGVPGTGAQFFQNRRFNTFVNPQTGVTTQSGKQFSVETGLEMTVLIRDFSNISSVPLDRICNKTYGTSANDSLSSFKWIRDDSACP